jgi:hypothetical protein
MVMAKWTNKITTAHPMSPNKSGAHRSNLCCQQNSKPLIVKFTIKSMVGSAVTRIDFDRLDSVKLILIKIDFTLK